MNLPNTLTTSRIGLTFLFIFFMTQEGLWAMVLATGVFLLASCTDYYDGYFAKKYNLVSDFGKIMDPIADKFLTIAAFSIFMKMGLVAVWMFALILIREVLVTGLRVFAIGKGHVIAAEKVGKYKTVAQMAAIIVILLFTIMDRVSFPQTFPIDELLQYWRLCIVSAMLVTVTLTVVSGALYVWKNRRIVYGAGSI